MCIRDRVLDALFGTIAGGDIDAGAGVCGGRSGGLPLLGGVGIRSGHCRNEILEEPSVRGIGLSVTGNNQRSAYSDQRSGITVQGNAHPPRGCLLYTSRCV